MDEWRSSPAIAILAIALFLTIQLAIPLSRLGDYDNSQRFGWQMFSTHVERIIFTVHTDATSSEVDLNEILARVRGDLPLTELVPPHLCRVTPDAERVTWSDEAYPC